MSANQVIRFAVMIDSPVLKNWQLKTIERLLENPNKGDLISGSGGLRKIRMARKGGGKSGGFRVIYYRTTPEVIFFLLAYPKNKQDSLSKAEVKLLRELIED